MKRILDHYLTEWRINPKRKPLVLRGARQVGKTHTVRNLGKLFNSYVEINFEQLPTVKDIFLKDLDPHRILKELRLIIGKDILPGETLLFLDEVQDVPQAIMALRYFYEEMPDLHVIAAGSLLDFAIEHISVPVGRVSFLYMHPMSFIEFLAAIGEKHVLVEILEHNPKEVLSEPVHQKLLNYLGVYLAVGGMPEAVQAWVDTQNIIECSLVHDALIEAYRQDFEKYSKKLQLKYVELLFKSIPLFLGRPIKFNKISNDYRKRELAPCLSLLEKANIISKVTCTSGNGIPLGAEITPEKFKAIFLDVALSQSMLGLDLKGWLLNPTRELINKGEIAEAFIGQELLAYMAPQKRADLYYWHREVRGSNAEVDYLMQHQSNIIPIEVKSALGTTLKSLHLFLETHALSPYGVRFSAHNYSVCEKVHSYPLYAVAGIFAENKEVLLTLI